MRFLIRNSIKTPDGKTLISHHRHDYRTHTDKDGNLYGVDGGLDYLKRIGKECKDTSVYSDAPFKKLRKAYYRSSYGENGDEPLTYIKLSKMETNHILNVLKGWNNIPNKDLKLSFYINLFLDELIYRDARPK